MIGIPTSPFCNYLFHLAHQLAAFGLQHAADSIVNYALSHCVF